MPFQSIPSVENNFTKGLITESTGLNFPENAATSTSNCEFTLVGDVLRRMGYDYEPGFNYNNVPNTNSAITTFKWDNVGGDGQTQIVVTQIGTTLYFYKSSAAVTGSPVSSQRIGSTVLLTPFTATNGTFDATAECQYSSGNGYLFVFHPSIDPVYCVYQAGNITGASIQVQARDFAGLPEGIGNTVRPLNLSNYHQYNLANQGWQAAPAWNFTSHSLISIAVGGNAVFTDAPAGITQATLGSAVTIQGGIITLFNGVTTTNQFVISGVITAYFGNTMQVTVNSFTGPANLGGTIVSETWYVQQGANISYTTTWHGVTGNYPSNSDVWWNFKNSSNVFDPSTTLNNVTLSSPAPKGSVILNAFNQQPTAVTGISGLGVTSTTTRPRTGCWFQGRVFYAGADGSSYTNGVTSQFYTWTENIYFSQVSVNDTTVFGKCYQLNDPTSETLFDLLPTDGGVITVQGSGAIYKLFPIQNGLLVFAANGVWFITGSQGIGFSANDYTVVKLSEVRSFSGSSFVNVLGLPYFWNEEGIYSVQPQQGGSLSVEPLTVGTILTYYNNIPLSSRIYARGAYDPLNYQIKWIFRSTVESDVTSRYQFDSVLNFNTFNKAFFPYLISGTPKMTSIIYVASPGSATAYYPTIKFFTEDNANNFTFAEEISTSYRDFISFDSVGADYTSFFVTGYKLKGQAIKKFQIQYINIYSRSPAANAYTIQGLWDFANQGNSNRWSTIQVVNNIDTRFDTVARRHRIRGRGYALQFKVSSVSGQPFDIQGWAVIDQVNAGA